MKSVRTVAVGMVFGAALLVPAGAAVAAANPSGTGLPGQSCQDITAAGGITPGHAASSPGSPFNESGQAGTVYAGNPDTASLAHANSTAAVSQYDAACVRLSH